MFLLLAALLFGAFGLNVAMGAFGGAAVLNSVQEMLLLLAAVIVFVVATLKAEADRKNDKKS